jgi:hypothetical protein
VREHPGVETRRQWSERAIACATPCRLAPFSVVTLPAARLGHPARLAVSTAAWHRKRQPTFVDALAAVRRQIRSEQGLRMSWYSPGLAKFPSALRESIADALRHAA